MKILLIQSREARTMQMSYIKGIIIFLFLLGSFEILMNYFINAIQADKS